MALHEVVSGHRSTRIVPLKVLRLLIVWISVSVIALMAAAMLAKYAYRSPPQREEIGRWFPEFLLDNCNFEGLEADRESWRMRFRYRNPDAAAITSSLVVNAAAAGWVEDISLRRTEKRVFNRQRGSWVQQATIISTADEIEITIWPPVRVPGALNTNRAAPQPRPRSHDAPASNIARATSTTTAQSTSVTSRS